ncbi:hypothetical protein FRC03_007220 [Tulasnella sp. 419]|nr:hypothetical protein FRC02_006789 [Tulasnella sp. 418]KAG8959994.1 hypothetical protein FRC03_007220 [Tulasnella sp. 419]
MPDTRTAHKTQEKTTSKARHHQADPDAAADAPYSSRNVETGHITKATEQDGGPDPPEKDPDYVPPKGEEGIEYVDDEPTV